MTARASASSRGARASAAVSVACLVLFALVMHWPVFLQGKTVSPFDLSYFQFIAYRAQRPADVERTSNGLLSDVVLLFNVWDKAMYEGPLTPPWLWNPYAACGTPQLGNGQSAPFCPLKPIAYGPFGVYRGFGVLCFLKMLCAGLFMWAYMRALGVGYLARTLAGIAFMACGFMIVWLEFPITSVAFTLPLVFLGCERLVQGRVRAGFLIVCVATAVGLLGGHPETSLHITVAAALYLVGRLVFSMFARGDAAALEDPTTLRSAAARTGVFAAALVLAAAVAAVQILPNLESIRASELLGTRSAKAASRTAGSVLSPGNLQRIHSDVLAYLVPNTWGNPSRHDHWWGAFSNYNESAGYVGLGTLLLACFAWRHFIRHPTIRILCVLQLLSLGFILKVPLINETLGRLPFLSIAANKRFLLVFCFANAAMAGLVFDDLLTRRTLSRVGIAWLSVIAVVFIALVLRDYIKRFATDPYDWIRAYGCRQLVHFFVFFLPWLAVPFLLRLRAPFRDGVSVLVVALLAADLYLIHFRYNPFIEPARIYPQTPALEFLEARPSPTRVLPLDAQIGPNVPALYGLQDPRIYDAVIYAPYAGFLERLGSQGPWHLVEEPDMRFASIAGVRYIYARPEWTPPAAPGLELVYEDDLSKIYENGEALPIAYVSRQWRRVASADEAYELLAQDDLPWQSTALVDASRDEAIGPAPRAEPRPHEPATIVEHRPHSVTVELPEQSAGLLVLSDCFYPGWKAFVDGEPRRIYRVNGTFRGVFVHGGDTTVVFEYHPSSFKYGTIVSLAGIAVLVAIATGLPGRLRRKPAASQR